VSSDVLAALSTVAGEAAMMASFARASTVVASPTFTTTGLMPWLPFVSLEETHNQSVPVAAPA